MKKNILISVILVLGFCSQGTSQNRSADYAALHAIVGTWSLETKRGVLYESWKKINDSTLSGVSYKLNGVEKGDTVFLEKVNLVSRNQKIMYIPVAANQNNGQPVIFTLTSVENGKYSFENPAHDFPQRIVYNLPVNDLLHAWIEGNSKDQ